MPVFDWDPAWETGVPEVDLQHRELLHRMSQMATAMAEGWQAAETERTLLHLGDYVETHFRTEENLMEKASYPGLAKHHASHNDLRAKVTSLAEAYHHDPLSLPRGLMDFLMSWLMDHLAGEDRLMAEFIKVTPRGI